MRSDLVDLQTHADPMAPTSLKQRLAGLVTQPFLTPPSHYEAPAWSTVEAIALEVEQFEASALSGIPVGFAFGLPLTLLAAVGAVGLMRSNFRGPLSTVDTRGLLWWLVLTALMALSNPLSWQRYYIPLLPLVILLSGLGGLTVWSTVRRIRAPVAAASMGDLP